MTVAEKTESIFKRFYELAESNFEIGKKNALACVDEIYLSLPPDENEPEHVYSDSQVYWRKVTEELIKRGKPKT